MKKSNNKITIILFIVLAVIIIMGIVVAASKSQKGKIVSVSSKKELMEIYENDYEDIPEPLYEFLQFTVLPFYFPFNFASSNIYDYDDVVYNSSSKSTTSSQSSSSGVDIPTAGTDTSGATSSIGLSIPTATRTTTSHSTTNIQVENVDEADINKTDGKYIYSISNQKVLVTDVSNPSRMEVVGELKQYDTKTPVDLILDSENHKLVVIYEDTATSSYNSDTVVTVYDISNIEKFKTEKTFKLYAKYYTSRETNGVLYIVATGSLKRDSKTDEIDISYSEDNTSKEIDLKNIQYIKGQADDYQTIVASYKLGSGNDINVHSYLFSVSNAYVSQNNIYLTKNGYDYGDDVTTKDLFKKLFGPGGVWGLIFAYIRDDYSYGGSTYTTQINKIELKGNGDVEYVNSTEVTGKTLNQFSMDEYNGELRVALYESGEGSRIVVFDKDLNQIGSTDYYEKNEQMYSSRFIGNRAYLVTYRNTDPLFVIDLSDGENPKLLGKLEIPGYSTYLHPYDENHIIGIGMNSEAISRKDSNGRVISTTTQITGMKMAIFDVTDVKNPEQISQTIIGDRTTTSAVLQNHKALLFSKEKGIICIPVNTYSREFAIEDSTNVQTVINNYSKYGSTYKKSEGYLVYNINLQDGFTLKGTVKHDVSDKYNSGSTDLLRGLWINDNLFTISQSEMKASRLSDLKLLDDLDLTTYKHITIKEEQLNDNKNDENNNSSNTVVVKSSNETEE